MPETIFQFLTKLSIPLAQRYGFAFYGMTADEDSHKQGIQVLRPGEEQPCTIWLRDGDVISAMRTAIAGALVRQIEAALEILQETRQQSSDGSTR